MHGSELVEAEDAEGARARYALLFIEQHLAANRNDLLSHAEEWTVPKVLTALKHRREQWISAALGLAETPSPWPAPSTRS
jgi:hypothetical protein